MVPKYKITNAEATAAYKEHEKLIHWVVKKFRGKLFSNEELDAIALEAFIRSVDRHVPATAKLTTFATKNMIYALVDAQDIHYRHTHRNVSYVGFDQYLTDEQEVNNINIDLNNLLHKLPERWRDVIIARRIEGKDLKDIAKDMGVTYQRVAEIESTAMKQLQKIVKEKV